MYIDVFVCVYIHIYILSLALCCDSLYIDILCICVYSFLRVNRPVTHVEAPA